MDNATYEAMQEVIGKLTVQNKQLRNTNVRLKRRNKALQYTIKKLRREQEQQKKKKQHYRNGRKRGTHGNGMHG